MAIAVPLSHGSFYLKAFAHAVLLAQNAHLPAICIIPYLTPLGVSSEVTPQSSLLGAPLHALFSLYGWRSWHREEILPRKGQYVQGPGSVTSGRRAGWRLGGIGEDSKAG